MLDISKLRLYPFKTKNLAFPDKKGVVNYDIIYFPENTTFQESYYKLNLRRIFMRKITVPQSKIPRIVPNSKILLPYKQLKLIPVLKIKDEDNNTIIDTSLFMDLLDEKFKKESYRRPIVAKRIISYLQFAKEQSPTNRKKVLVYHIDYDKEFSDKIEYKRIFPLLLDLKKTKGFNFDYVLFAVTSDGSTVYTSFKNSEEILSFGRIYSLLNSIKSKSPEQINAIESKLNDMVSDKVVDRLMLVDENELPKLKKTVSNFLKLSPEINKSHIIHQDSMDENNIVSMTSKAILTAISGNKLQAQKIVDNIPDEKKLDHLKKIKDDLLHEIVPSDEYINEANDAVNSKVKLLEINNDKEPSKVLNKRIVDFEITFQKDILNAFKTLENQMNPLFVKNVRSEKVPIDPGDMYPSKMIRYTFSLSDKSGKIHEVVIDIPEIDSDGTFTISGQKKFLIYQLILDPIYFIKEDLAKLETLYAAASVHHKVTKYKSFYESRIGGFNLPLILALSYYIGFTKTLDLYGIKYNITDKTPDKKSTYYELSDNKYIVLNFENESQKRLINSFFEIKYKEFTSENINDKKTMDLAIVKHTSNRNSIYILNKVLSNIMEPVAVQILKSKLLPYTYESCMKYMCDELAKGRVDKRNDLSHQRIRSSEVFAHQIIKTIQTSYSEYESRILLGDGEAEFKCDTRKIVQDITNSQLMRPLENINPFEELSCLTRITPVGLGGVPDGRSLTNKDRSIDESYIGQIDATDTPEGSCFLYNTLIKNGLGSEITIDNLKIGDKIIWTDKKLYNVINKWNRQKLKMVLSTEKDTIYCSKEHKYPVYDKLDNIETELTVEDIMKDINRYQLIRIVEE